MLTARCGRLERQLNRTSCSCNSLATINRSNSQASFTGYSKVSAPCSNCVQAHLTPAHIPYSDQTSLFS